MNRNSLSSRSGWNTSAFFPVLLMFAVALVIVTSANAQSTLVKLSSRHVSRL